MEKIFTIDSKELKCIINKRAKKNIIFKFQNKELHISIPKNFPIKNLQKIIETKAEWIYEKLDYINNSTNDKFLFLGMEFGKIGEIFDYYKKNFSSSIKSPSLVDIAEELFKNRLDVMCEKTGLYPQKLRIKKLKSAWGICYRNQSITLNLLLLCCPVEVIDYVIIHELSHLKHMNHSVNFWKEVGLHNPDFKTSKIWLKTNGTKIFHQSHL